MRHLSAGISASANCGWACGSCITIGHAWLLYVKCPAQDVQTVQCMLWQALVQRLQAPHQCVGGEQLVVEGKETRKVQEQKLT